MAITTKGMRALVVADERYHWRFRNDEECWVAGYVVVVRAKDNVRGARPRLLSFGVPGLLRDVATSPEPFVVTPRIVRRAIEHALSTGFCFGTGAAGDLTIPIEVVPSLFVEVC